MRRYSTNYWKWAAWFLTYLFALLVLSFCLYQGITYDKKYAMDLTGYLLTFCMVVAIGFMIWELTQLFDFVLRGVTGDIDMSDNEMTITINGRKETLRYKDVRRVEFVSPRFGSKTVTSEVSHCKLTFSERTIYLTSFTIKNEEIANHLKIKASNVRNRERRYFELMH